MYTLDNIKDSYYTLISQDYTESMSFEQFLQTWFIPVYDSSLNFLGYEHA